MSSRHLVVLMLGAVSAFFLAGANPNHALAIGIIIGMICGLINLVIDGM